MSTPSGPQLNVSRTITPEPSLVTKSGESLHGNYLFVKHPVSLTWKRISVFVKTPKAEPPKEHRSYGSAAQSPLGRPERHDRFDDVQNDVDHLNMGISTDDVKMGCCEFFSTKTLAELAGRATDLRGTGQRIHPRAFSYQLYHGLTYDLRPDGPKRGTTLKDRNMSATGETDAGTTAERQERQDHENTSQAAFPDDHSSARNNVGDFQTLALAHEDAGLESKYSRFRDEGAEDRNENYPSNVEKERTGDRKPPEYRHIVSLHQNPTTETTSAAHSSTGVNTANTAAHSNTGVNTANTAAHSNTGVNTANTAAHSNTGVNTANTADNDANTKRTKTGENQGSVGKHEVNVAPNQGRTIDNVSAGVNAGGKETDAGRSKTFVGENRAVEGEDEAYRNSNETRTSTARFLEPVAYDFPSDWDSSQLRRVQSSGTIEKGGRMGLRRKEDSLGSSMEHKYRKSSRWKPILKELTGIAEPGTLLAVLGASGSGKTTLMSVLSGRSSPGCHVSGSVRVNGVMAHQDQLRHLCAYVPQQQLLLPYLTVTETLIFRATLELGSSSKAERRKMVMDILRDMALTKAADTMVGSPETKKGLSGGELKRLSFACELLSNPPIFLCDEPTSGLDSSMAEHTVRVLQTLADRQHTVICTIHQPSSRTFSYFHKVLVLTGGRTAFHGTSAQAVDFFTSLGHACPLNYNPADFFLEALSLPPGHSADTHYRDEEISEAFLRTTYACEMLSDVRQVTFNSLTRAPEIRQLLCSNVRGPASWVVQCRANVWRCWTCMKRDTQHLWTKLVCGAVVALVVAAFFFRLNVDSEGRPGYTQTSALNVNGAIFVITSITAYANAQRVICAFPQWLPIVLRDHHNHLYRLHAFYLAACLTHLPLQLMVPLFTITLDYWAVGLVPEVGSFLTAVGIVLLSATTSVAYGQAVSALVGDTSIALTVSSAILMPLLLLSGFLLNLGSIPVWASWLRYVSWIMHTNQLLMLNQWLPVEQIRCPAANGSGCLFRDGADVLREFHVNADDMVELYVNLAVLLVMFYLLSFLALFVRAKWN